MASRRQDTQLEKTRLFECGTGGDTGQSPDQHDERHARRLLRALSDYLDKEIVRHMS